MLYTVGRAMLWVVVLSAIYSMWGYFRIFFTTVLRGEKKVPAARSSSATVQSGEAAR
jgi:hypothetical protein